MVEPPKQNCERHNWEVRQADPWGGKVLKSCPCNSFDISRPMNRSWNLSYSSGLLKGAIFFYSVPLAPVSVCVLNKQFLHRALTLNCTPAHLKQIQGNTPYLEVLTCRKHSVLGTFTAVQLLKATQLLSLTLAFMAVIYSFHNIFKQAEPVQQ